jgi:23S rRNA (uridine2552-2'-O)-methyltransferase
MTASMAEPHGPGRRNLKVRVRTAKRRKASSVRWLERQLNDPYVARAQAEHRRSRSAYKLEEIDDRFHLLGRGKRVVDLGAAPGGWSEVAAERVESRPGQPLVVALDKLPMDPLPGVTVVEMDFFDDKAPDVIRAAHGGAPIDVVLSDMAAPTTGHRQTDHLRTMQLCEAAADFALSVLAPGGAFVGKVFQGGTETELLARLKRAFSSVQHAKPPASRSQSVELYLVARGCRGGATRAPA